MPATRRHQDQGFPHLLRQSITSAGMLPIDFARRINRTPSYVYGLVNGRHFKPPKDAAALREWAVVLGLSQPATRRFLLAAALERCPIEVRDEFRRLRRLERAGRR